MSVWRILLCCLLVTGCQSDKPETKSADKPDSENQEPATKSPPSSENKTPANKTPPQNTPQPSPTPPDAQQASAEAAQQLEEKLTNLQVPPTWLEETKPEWSVDRPWKEGRLEIRRLLGLGDETSRRQGVKLMTLYRDKDDIGDGHEIAMYLYLGGEPLWSIIEFRKYLKKDHNHPPYFAIRSLAALYTEHGLFTQAVKLLTEAMEFQPPDKRWIPQRKAELHNSLGDVYLAWGRTDDARQHYTASVKLFPTAKPPYGGHLLKRRAKAVQAKLDMMAVANLDSTSLRDGVYRHTALGYSGDVKLTVTVTNGKVADIQVQHQEKIDQNACVIVPRRIVDQQSLQVDGISGATVTTQAITSGTLEALKQGGLK